ncbi:MAG: hypothetical protein IPG79_02230 [Saprospiraceae bacterium]|nr:hypothetical protein [Saprospiraceae bacterium]
MQKLKNVKGWFQSDSINGILLNFPGKIRQKGTYFKALLALAVVSLVWGTTWVVSKVGVGFLPGLQLASIRQIIAGTAFLVYFFVKNILCPKGQIIFH